MSKPNKVALKTLLTNSWQLNFIKYTIEKTRLLLSIF